MTPWHALDTQMQRWAGRLRDDVGLSIQQSRRPVSEVAEEMAAATPLVRSQVTDASPVPLTARRDELLAFDAWLTKSAAVKDPVVGRARILTQCYMCFIYLKDRWFQTLGQSFPPDATVARCCSYLVSGQRRAFRNAFAHGNWCYSADHEAIEYWDRGSSGGGFERHVAGQQELDFWQALSRGVAYASIQTSLDLAA